MSKEVLDYIQEQLNAGYSKEAIGQVLVESGWQMAQVDEAFAHIEQRHARSQVAEFVQGGGADPENDQPSGAELAASNSRVHQTTQALHNSSPTHESSQAPVANKPVVPQSDQIASPAGSEPMAAFDPSGSESQVLHDVGGSIPEIKPGAVGFDWGKHGRLVVGGLMGLVLLLLIGGGVWGYFAVWMSPERIIQTAMDKEIEDPMESGWFEMEASINVETKNSHQVSQLLNQASADDSRVLGIEYTPYTPLLESAFTPEKVKVAWALSGSFDFRDEQAPKGELSSDWKFQESQGGLTDDFEGVVGLDVKIPNLQSLFVRGRLTGGEEVDLGSVEGLLNTWISIDDVELEEAYQEFLTAYNEEQVEAEANKSEEDIAQEAEIERILEESNMFVVVDRKDDQEINGQGMFVFSYEIDKEALKRAIIEIASLERPIEEGEETLLHEAFDVISQPKGEVWIGKKDGRWHRMDVAIDVEDVELQTRGTLAFSFTRGGINEDITVEEPPDAISMAEFENRLAEVMSSTEFASAAMFDSTMYMDEGMVDYNYDGSGESDAATRDAQRMIDLVMLTQALELYYATNGTYPVTIPAGEDNSVQIGTGPGNLSLEFLVPDYMLEIPIEPVLGTEVNTGYYVYLVDGSEDDVVIWTRGETDPVLRLDM